MHLLQINDTSVKSVSDNVQGNKHQAISSEEFIDILQKLSEGQPISNNSVNIECEQEVGKNCQLEISTEIFDTTCTESNCFSDEELMLAPKALNFDIRQNTDLNLEILPQGIEDQQENKDIVGCMMQENLCGIELKEGVVVENLEQKNPYDAELKFPFNPVQFKEQEYVYDDKISSQEGEFINDRYNIISKKVGVIIPSKYDDATPYYQNDYQEVDELSFIFTKVDTTTFKQDKKFDRFVYEYKDSVYELGHEHAYTSYFNQQKGILNHKINLSLKRLDSKLIDQVNFSISNTLQEDNKRFIVQLEPAELGKIEIIVDICGRERNIAINADKISTYELLRKYGNEFLDNIKSADAENNLLTNIAFSYKDLSQNADENQEFDLQKRIDVYNEEDGNVANDLQLKKISMLFIPIDIDKQLDILV